MQGRAALGCAGQQSQYPLLADFCRMVFPQPAVRQIIGKSIENVGRTLKVDPNLPSVSGRYVAAQ
jgi:hypothetical protein